MVDKGLLHVSTLKMLICNSLFLYTKNLKKLLTTILWYVKIFLSAHGVLEFGGVLMAENNKELICDEVSSEIIRVADRMVREGGVESVNVRRIITDMGVTNRVFYNRFKNIDEVLEFIYKKSVIKMRDSITSEYDLKTDFYNYVMDISVKVLEQTYDVKKQFSQYMFEFDSKTNENCEWWTESIKEIIDVAIATKQIREVDSYALGYTLWSFLRGYNVDALKRGLSKGEAVERFKISFGYLLEGVKK